MKPGKQTGSDLDRRVWMVKVIARVGLGLVWFFEGLFPKLLLVLPREVELVRRSGLFWATPEFTLNALGVGEMALGLWLIWGAWERMSALIATGAMVVLTVLVLHGDPTAIADPYGGIIKHFGLTACAAVVWLLSPVAPSRMWKKEA